MKRYKNLYIDGATFKNEKEIDDFLMDSAIQEYKIRCKVFSAKKTLASAEFADEQATFLHDTYGISWEELERIEIETYQI